MSLHIDYYNRLAFLEGQMELYKQKFIDTDNRNYLEVMNELNKTIDYIRNTYDIMNKMGKELATQIKPNADF